MERLMYSFTFPHIDKMDVIDFSKPVIWILNATKTPPHIGLSINKKYFSLKANGKDESIEIQLLLDLIQRKKIATVFVELSQRITENDVLSCFQNFQRAGKNQTTCLSPISQLLEKTEAKQLSVLLHSIQNDIKRIGGINLPENYTALPTYSIEAIHQHIEDLKIYVGE